MFSINELLSCHISLLWVAIKLHVRLTCMLNNELRNYIFKLNVNKM